MNSNELKRWLSKKGAQFGGQKGSHLKVHLNGKRTILPMHGKKEVGTGLLKKIMKDLGIDQE